MNRIVDDAMERERSRSMAVTSARRRNGQARTVQAKPAHYPWNRNGTYGTAEQNEMPETMANEQGIGSCGK